MKANKFSLKQRVKDEITDLILTGVRIEFAYQKRKEKKRDSFLQVRSDIC